MSVFERKWRNSLRQEESVSASLTYYTLSQFHSNLGAIKCCICTFETHCNYFLFFIMLIKNIMPPGHLPELYLYRISLSQIVTNPFFFGTGLNNFDWQLAKFFGSVLNFEQDLAATSTKFTCTDIHLRQRDKSWSWSAFRTIHSSLGIVRVKTTIPTKLPFRHNIL